MIFFDRERKYEISLNEEQQLVRAVPQAQRQQIRIWPRGNPVISILSLVQTYPVSHLDHSRHQARTLQNAHTPEYYQHSPQRKELRFRELWLTEWQEKEV